MNHESVHSLLHTIELAYLDKLREVVDPEWGAGADLVVEAEAVLNGVRDILEGRAIT